MLGPIYFDVFGDIGLYRKLVFLMCSNISVFHSLSMFLQTDLGFKRGFFMKMRFSNFDYFILHSVYLDSQQRTHIQKYYLLYIPSESLVNPQLKGITSCELTLEQLNSITNMSCYLKPD